MEWLQVPHWLMIAGTLLVIAGLIGLVASRRQQRRRFRTIRPPSKVPSRVHSCRRYRIF